MNRITAIFSAFLFSTSVFAADVLLCDRVGEGKGPHSLAIEITNDTIVTTDLERSHEPQIWNREDAGIYSYWGTDASEMNTTNERLIDHVRFDIGDRKMIADIRVRTFEMEIAFIWESLYFDSSGLRSEDLYSCKKI